MNGVIESFSYQFKFEANLPTVGGTALLITEHGYEAAVPAWQSEPKHIDGDLEYCVLRPRLFDCATRPFLSDAHASLGYLAGTHTVPAEL